MKAPDWQARWRDTWSGLGLGTLPLHQLEELLARYREPQRHYHMLQHLDQCFAGYAQLREQMRRPAEVALALCYHDTAILLDIDLAILGAAPDVPAHIYRERRREVLDSFRRRPALFKTTAFQAMLERQAHENLDAAIGTQAGC